MKTRSILLLLLAAAALPAQTRTQPVLGPDGKPLIGPDGKPATVTLSVDEKPAPGPPLSTLPPDKVILTIGDQKITAAYMDRLIESLPEQLRASARGAARRQFAENIVRVKLLAEEARKRKLDQTPQYQVQVAFQAENTLAMLLFNDMSKNAPVTESAARAWFDQHKGEYERVRARHILIRMKGSPVPTRPEQKDLTEEEALAKAQQVRKQLLAGADFATLAKAESDDTGSAANGGELGTFGHGQMVPSFDEAAFALPVGQVSEPVRSQFGYHIIRVEAKESKTFEEVRPEIEKRLRPEMAKKSLEEMRNSAAVTMDPAYFGEEKKEEKKPQ